MKRKIAAIALLLAFAASVSGCSSLFDKQYLAVSDYESETTYDSSINSTEIKNYYSLKGAINLMVNNHDDYGELIFKSYEGDVSNDLAQACWEVKNETAFGSYSVDYMSYEIDHIVSYDKAYIYITYKRTLAEISSIIRISDTGSISGTIENSMDAMDESLLIWVLTSTVDSDMLSEYFEKTYYSYPMLAVVKPVVVVESYPETGVHRIYDISLTYGYPLSDLLEMKEKLKAAVAARTFDLTGNAPEFMALDTCGLLSNICFYDPDGEMRKSSIGGDDILGYTAYGALVDKYANSEGFAMAYKALCDSLGIECTVVRGRLDKAEHAWNIIKLDDAFYHVDVSQCASNGVAASFLNADSDMWGRYWWDIDKYPACEGLLDYYDLVPATEESEQ